VLTSSNKDRWWTILLGIVGPFWLYASYAHFLKGSMVNAACLFAMGALAVIIAIHSFTSSNQAVRAGLFSAWIGVSGLFTVLRAIREGQKDDAGRWILLGTLALMVLVAMVYLLWQGLSKLKARRTGPDSHA
jgi:peptidoglycan/LPS O-acetylase OafA/YrhL